MNQLRSWLYGHDFAGQDRLSRDARPATDESELEDEGHLQQRHKQLESTSTSKSESTESSLRSVLLKVIPLAPGDCLECKLVGTSVMMISGVMVMMSAVTARKRNPKLTGVNGAVFYLLCSSLFLGFQVTAFYRLFDMGPFDKHRGKVLRTTTEH